MLVGGRERIKLNTYKDFVAVLVEQGQSANFLNSVGLMGDFRTGNMLARDGTLMTDNWNATVRNGRFSTQANLFHTVRLPQHLTLHLAFSQSIDQLRRRLAATFGRGLRRKAPHGAWQDGACSMSWRLVISTWVLPTSLPVRLKEIRGVELLLHFIR
jgi:hypothetical protein